MLASHPVMVVVSNPQALSKLLKVLPPAIVHLLVVGPQLAVLTIRPAFVPRLAMAVQGRFLTDFMFCCELSFHKSLTSY